MLVAKEPEDCVLLYLGLKALIESAEGHGFHNKDQGHPVYAAGAEGEAVEADGPDGPDQNRVFQMLRQLSEELRNAGYTDRRWWYDFDSWKAFCSFTYDAYKRNRGRERGA